MSEEKIEDINLKVDELHEVLSTPPNWLVRWGISVIFFSLVLLFVFSYFIKYPDKLAATATITTLNPPTRLLAKTTGKISHILFRNNDLVKANDVLAVIENVANYKDVLVLDSLTNVLINAKDAELKPINFLKLNNLTLGDITTTYSSFEKNYQDYSIYLETSPQAKEIAFINTELHEYNSLVERYTKQEEIYGEEFELIEKDFNRVNGLFKDGIISEKELEDKKREYLQSKRSYESVKITTINTKITINNLEKTKLQLQQQQYEQGNKYILAYTESLKGLKSIIDNWKKQYLIQAPTNGKVVFNNVWAVNQNININDEILTIVSPEKQNIICKLTLPTNNTGKLKLHQTVHIQLSDYPYQEYGFLIGKVTSIPAVANNANQLLIDVEIPNQLITNYKKQLAYKDEMKGIAYIITDDVSLLGRFFNQFRTLIKGI